MGSKYPQLCKGKTHFHTFQYISSVFPGFPVTSTSTEGQDQRTDSHCQLSSDFKLLRALEKATIPRTEVAAGVAATTGKVEAAT